MKINGSFGETRYRNTMPVTLDLKEIPAKSTLKLFLLTLWLQITATTTITGWAFHQNVFI